MAAASLARPPSAAGSRHHCVLRVEIGAAGQKRIDGLRTTVLGRIVQRGPAILVLRVEIGAAGQKRRDGRRVASLGRIVQRGLAILDLRVGIVALGQKRRNLLYVAFPGLLVQLVHDPFLI